MSTFSLFSKRFMGWLLLMLLIVLGIRFSRSAWDMWKLRSRVTEAEAEVRALAQKKTNLEQQVQAQNQPFFVEKEIRDELKMAKPDETVVVMPDEKGLQATSYKLQADDNNQLVLVERANWEKWWAILSGTDNSNQGSK